MPGHPERPGPGPDSLTPEAQQRQWWWLLQQHLDDWHEITDTFPVGLRQLRRDLLLTGLGHAQETATLAGWPQPPEDVLQQWRDLADSLDD